jgi:hypothetical protein
MKQKNETLIPVLVLCPSILTGTAINQSVCTLPKNID